MRATGSQQDRWIKQQRKQLTKRSKRALLSSRNNSDTLLTSIQGQKMLNERCDEVLRGVSNSVSAHTLPGGHQRVAKDVIKCGTRGSRVSLSRVVVADPDHSLRKHSNHPTRKGGDRSSAMQQLQQLGWRQQGCGTRLQHLSACSRPAPAAAVLPALPRRAPLQAACDHTRPHQLTTAPLPAQPQRCPEPEQQQRQRQAVRCAAGAGAAGAGAAADAPQPTASWKVPAYILLW